MKTLTRVLVALALLFAGAAQAEDVEGIGFGPGKANLVKTSFRAGRVGLDLYADGGLDVAALVADLDLSKSASPQAIADRVNEKRLALFPDDEILLAITPPKSAGTAASEDKVILVKALYWWNNTNCSTCYWYAQYTSTVATMFIDDVQQGAYKIYDKVGSGNWVYRYLVQRGGGATRYIYGANALKGFKGAANGVASKADIVQYFFR